MAIFTDQLGRTVPIDYPPERIISLVPSQTELLAALQLNVQVAGITKFCHYPATWRSGKAIVGGTKNINVEAVAKINPDLVIANKEENCRQQIEELARSYPVWVSDVNSLDLALKMIRSLGEITNRLADALQLLRDISTAFNGLIKNTLPISAVYLIWKDPYMAAGGDTFIHSMMNQCGFINVFAALQRYPVVTLQDIRQSGCKFVLLSSEPYPFQQKQLDELRSKLPGQHVILVDGSYFSWYGSRLVLAPAYFTQLMTGIHQALL